MTVQKVYTLKEVARHTTEDDCWVVHADKVYDVSSFVADHPGGEEFILDHAGKDITELMKDELEHLHSEGAYDMLDELLIGVLDPADCRTGATGAEAGSGAIGGEKDGVKPTSAGWAKGELKNYSAEDATDIVDDHKKEKFMDLSKPLLYQLWKANYSKDFYMKQIHIPRHLPYSARVFESDFLEVFSRTPWWVVPVLWLPVVGLMFSWSMKETARGLIQGSMPLKMEEAGWIFGVGIATWSLAEYAIHRFLFHVDDLLPDSTYSNVAHFLLHGIHHYLPMDRLRLVMPPVLTILIGSPLYALAHTLFRSHVADALMAGTYFGYICYDMIHYYLHHARVFEFHFKEMKTYHLAHHYKNYDNGYGITSKVWDRIFGTLLEM